MPQVRLVQESYNVVSLGLYLRAGFRVVAPLLELELAAGTTPVPPRAPTGLTVRPAASDDRTRLGTRDARAFGTQRPQSVDLYLRRGQILVAERGGAFTGYGMGIGFATSAFLGSAAADDPETLLLLLGMLATELAASGHGVRVLVPAADRRLVEGLLGFGFRVFRACH